MLVQVRRAGVAILAICALSGCANLGYYWQSVNGHLDMLNAARPVQERLQDLNLSAAQKEQLALSQRIRRYASLALHLPDNAAYTRFADLKRAAVVWNVSAAPANSLQLKTWCFVVAGCVSYRGYYAQADALALAEELKTQGMEVSVQPVPAYSTLGKLNWLGDYGADPLLNTFMHYPQGELARLIFHELAHQVLYVGDDTVFNESFATAVERIGVRQWLQQHATPSDKLAFDERDRRADDFRKLTATTRERLNHLYRQNFEQNSMLVSVSIDSNATQFVAKKAAIMQALRDEYAQLKLTWGGFSGYDGWIARANNASLAAQGAYDELVPQFVAVYERSGKDWPKFYDAIKAMVPLPKDERRAALAQAAGTLSR